MENLDYFECGNRIRIVCGSDSLKRIADLLHHADASRPMLITDKHVAEAGLTDLVSQHLSGKAEPTSIVETIPSISSVAEVHRIAQIFFQTDCDSILAVGGGSVIDTAKGVNLAVAEEVEDITRLAGMGMLKHRLLPLIAIPTTAAGGTEVTGTAVLLDPIEHRKWFFVSPFIIPTAAVIDPNMTATLSMEATAAGAMNALGHAMEACISFGRNPVSHNNALSAIRLIRTHLFETVQSPQDLSGRMALSLAACLAGMAMSDSKAGCAYALGHGLSALCQIPHSFGMAILLPYVLAFNLPKIRSIADQLLLHLSGPERYIQTPRHLRAEQLAAFVLEINQRLSELTQGKFVNSLAALNHPDERPKIPLDILNAVAGAACNNTMLLYSSHEIEKRDLLHILEHAWEGRCL